MKNVGLALGLLLVSALAEAGVVVLSPPPPPNSGVPTTANRTVMCVGVDVNGVAYCNAIYTWKRYVNRFCCSNQRDFGFAAYPDGQVIWLQPAVNKSDTRIEAVSNDGRRIGGTSMGPKASLHVATLWSDFVPQTFEGGAVPLVSNTSYALETGDVLNYEGVSVKPSDCAAVYALNDVGDGVCIKGYTDIDGYEHAGLARFSQAVTEDNAAEFITINMSPYSISMNNRGDVVATYSYITSANYIVAMYGQPTVIYNDGFVGGINDLGVYAGATPTGGALWSNGNANVIAGTTYLSSVNTAGVAVGYVKGVAYSGVVYTP